MLCWTSAALSKRVGFIGAIAAVCGGTEAAEGASVQSRPFSRDRRPKDKSCYIHFYRLMSMQKDQLNMTGGRGTFPEAPHRYRALYKMGSFMYIYTYDIEPLCDCRVTVHIRAAKPSKAATSTRSQLHSITLFVPYS